MKNNNYLKAPFNYIGNKYRILPHIIPLFPENIEIMVDLFCGGCDVILNTPAKIKVANDINFHVIGIMQEFKKRPDEIIEEIYSKIDQWKLSKDNAESYIAYRDFYNKTRNPLDLYVLMCYSFNYQFRFNSKHEYNNPFGKDRSSFNNKMKENLKIFLENIADIRFLSKDFTEVNMNILTDKDFVYADPPYTITCGSYNDGKRGFKGWDEDDDIKLFTILSELDSRGVKFALSNLLEHKGKFNYTLAEWVKERNYTVHDIKFNYNNCNYQTRNKENNTREVLVVNY